MPTGPPPPSTNARSIMRNPPIFQCAQNGTR
jgi:hypothetical protein